MPEATKLKLRASKRLPDDQVNYSAAHKRVRTVRGTPSYCEFCHRTDDGVRYNWASLTGNYVDEMDYIRLCVPCHLRFDVEGSILECPDCGSRKRRVRRRV